MNNTDHMGLPISSTEELYAMIKVWKTVPMRGEDGDEILIRSWQDLISYVENSFDVWLEKYSDEEVEQGVSLPIQLVSINKANISRVRTYNFLRGGL